MTEANLQETIDVEEKEVLPVSNRDTIRNAILTGRVAKTLLVTAFGIELEMRQPSLGDILDLQDMESTKERVIQSLINYCYVPGTKEKVFDVADNDILAALPFDDNFTAIQEAIADLTGVDVDNAKGNSEDDPVSITS